jgi:hypothetical protein
VLGKHALAASGCWICAIHSRHERRVLFCTQNISLKVWPDMFLFRRARKASFANKSKVPGVRSTTRQERVLRAISKNISRLPGPVKATAKTHDSR